MDQHPAATPSIWTLITSWLTPTYLFVLLNLVIGTIALSSRTSIQKKTSPEDPLETREASSLLCRVGSFKLGRGTLALSQSCPSLPEKGVDVALLKKTVSEKTSSMEAITTELESVEQRRPETCRAKISGFFEDEGVDAKADDFINRFRQQLKLQRLDSLLRRRE